MEMIFAVMLLVICILINEIKRDAVKIKKNFDTLDKIQVRLDSIKGERK